MLWTCALTSLHLWKLSMASSFNRKRFPLPENLLFWVSYCQLSCCDSEVVSFPRPMNSPLLASDICSLSEPSELKTGGCCSELVVILWGAVAAGSSTAVVGCQFSVAQEKHSQLPQGLTFGHVAWLFGRRESLLTCVVFLTCPLH